ncbi:MAG: hypothetical protein ACI4LQ_02555, partial [Anaerovoracaceae bacterium]
GNERNVPERAVEQEEYEAMLPKITWIEEQEQELMESCKGAGALTVKSVNASAFFRGTRWVYVQFST